MLTFVARRRMYRGVRFQIETIDQALSLLRNYMAGRDQEVLRSELWIDYEDGRQWLSDARIFLRTYHKGLRAGFVRRVAVRSVNPVDWEVYGLEVVFDTAPLAIAGTQVRVEAMDQQQVDPVIALFDQAVEAKRVVPLPSTPQVFIGHGHSHQWRILADELEHKHGYSVEAYETGARAGHHIRDILQSMLVGADFAVLLLTGDDQFGDAIRARQNVIHEAGLFQGKLGFHRAIIALEEGVEEFSNLYGIQQIRFPRESVQSAVGEIVATLRREFVRSG